jgi:thiol-disulfide isomerase/thioredoxin
MGGFLSYINAGKPGNGVSVGDKALDITFTTLNGSRFKLSDQRGKVVVIDFITTTCSVCVEEFKVLKQFEGEKRAIFISINVDDSNPTTLQAFAASYGLNWTVGSSPSTGVDYKVSGVPTLLVIDKDGVIRYRDYYTTFEQLNLAISRYS